MKNLLNFEQLMEKITLDINVGDTLLGGKWKNKQIVVKHIGKDGKGQPTINGKPLLSFRIWNELPQTLKDKYKLKNQKEE